jgi:hypothetical protein
MAVAREKKEGQPDGGDSDLAHSFVAIPPAEKAIQHGARQWAKRHQPSAVEHHLLPAKLPSNDPACMSN